MSFQHEHNLQKHCVRWFRYQWPQYGKLLIAIPNGGYRHRKTAAMLKAEGVVSGVSDLILFVPRGEFHGMAIEMKIKGKYPTQAQKEWQAEVEKQGYQTHVCYDFDSFRFLINTYLSQTVSKLPYLQ